MTAPAPRLHQTEVDGVPTLWADLPGPRRAGLVLRVGSADETLLTAGISHLVEHLALFGVDRPGDHSNGHVEPTITVFHCVGDDATVVDFMAAVAGQLSDLPTHRLDVERGVLKAEAARSQGSLHGTLSLWRYGARTFGLPAQEQLGVDRVSAEDLRAWAARFATRDNAVCWLSGPPPAGLRLPLPAGERQPAPDAAASILPDYPAWFVGPGDRVGLTAVIPRGYANRALTFVLRGRLVDELRTRRAAAYSPDATYRPLDGQVGELFAASDLVAGRQSDGVRPFVAALEQLGGPDGVQAEDLAAWRAAADRERAEPMSAFGPLVGNAFELLHGNELISAEVADAGSAAVTEADVAAAARAALGSALAAIPDGVRMSREPWRPAPVTSYPLLTGTRYHRVGRPAGGSTLVVGPDGLMLESGESRISAPVEAVVAVQHWADGRRMVVVDDSNRVVVEPTLWEDGPALVARLDEVLPADLRVDMGRRRPDEIPKPDPAASAAAAEQAAAAAARPVWERGGPRVTFALFVLLAVVALVAAAAVDQPAIGAVGAGVFAYSAYDLRRKAKRERR